MQTLLTIVIAALTSASLLVSSPALACDAPTSAEKSRLRETLRKDPQLPRGLKVNIRFPKCLAPMPDRIVVESGVGHGGYLRLDELRLSAQPGGTVSTTSLIWSKTATVTVQSGTLAWKDVQRAIRDARILIGTTVAEHVTVGLGMSAWSSASDFSSGVHLYQGTSVTGRYFVGYASSGRQLDYAPIVVAQQAFGRLLEKGQKHSKRDVAASMFRERFQRADYRIPHGWWVHERLLAAAAHFGDTSIGPLLIADSRQAVKGVHRIQKAALDALASWSGQTFLKLPTDTKTWTKSQFQSAYRAAASDYETWLRSNP